MHPRQHIEAVGAVLAVYVCMRISLARLTLLVSCEVWMIVPAEEGCRFVPDFFVPIGCAMLFESSLDALPPELVVRELGPDAFFVVVVVALFPFFAIAPASSNKTYAAAPRGSLPTSLFEFATDLGPTMNAFRINNVHASIALGTMLTAAKPGSGTFREGGTEIYRHRRREGKMAAHLVEAHRLGRIGTRLGF